MRNTTETTIRSHRAAEEYLSDGRNRNDRPAPSGTSVRIVRDFVTHDTISVVYHKTPVVTYHRDGRTVFYAGGWATKTTAAVMQEYAPVSIWVQVKREGTDWPKSKLVTASGITMGPQDRHGSGDVFLVTYRDEPIYTIAFRDSESHWAGENTGRRMGTVHEAAEYPCKCRTCTGRSGGWR